MGGTAAPASGPERPLFSPDGRGQDLPPNSTQPLVIDNLHHTTVSSIPRTFAKKSICSTPPAACTAKKKSPEPPRRCQPVSRPSIPRSQPTPFAHQHTVTGWPRSPAHPSPMSLVQRSERARRLPKTPPLEAVVMSCAPPSAHHLWPTGGRRGGEGEGPRERERIPTTGLILALPRPSSSNPWMFPPDMCRHGSPRPPLSVLLLPDVLAARGGWVRRQADGGASQSLVPAVAQSFIWDMAHHAWPDLVQAVVLEEQSPACHPSLPPFISA